MSKVSQALKKVDAFERKYDEKLEKSYIFKATGWKAGLLMWGNVAIYLIGLWHVVKFFFGLL